MSSLQSRSVRLPWPGGAAPATLILLVALVMAGTAVAAATDEATTSARRWAFGWDPGDSGAGLTVRWRPTPMWDLSVAAGPNDYRYENEQTSWDSEEEVIDDGTGLNSDDRQEQGWVRLAVGRQFWKEGRFAVHGEAGATYRWSVEEWRRREARNVNSQDWDWYNIRDHTDRERWWLTLGVRPSFVVTRRLQVEFECGLRLGFETAESDRQEWWDTRPGEERTEESVHNRHFQTYGGFELYRLRFIFWF